MVAGGVSIRMEESLYELSEKEAAEGPDQRSMFRTLLALLYEGVRERELGRERENSLNLDNYVVQAMKIRILGMYT